MTTSNSSKHPQVSYVLGQNVSAKVEGSTLTITVDLSARLGPSSTGKNTKIASTGGNVMVPLDTAGAKLGINVFCPVGK